MMDSWQYLPLSLDPIVYTVGSFSLRWYSFCWLAGFFSALFIARYFAPVFALKKEDVYDGFLFLFLGAFLGGRLGYAFLYRPGLFMDEPVLLFSPVDGAGVWTGLSGMSFFGGLLGASIALFLFAKLRKISVLRFADVAALSLPAALFFGRVGNFLNQELYGRETTSVFGMVFPLASGVRHPSALYEALFEGVILLGIGLFFRSKIQFQGGLAAMILFVYSLFRFGLEYTREPDQGLSLWFPFLTHGQFFSLCLMLISATVFWWFRGKNRGIL